MTAFVLRDFSHSPWFVVLVRQIKHGSTNVRVGSTIFGHRDYSQELKASGVPTDVTDLAAVQHRREWAVRFIQGFQRFMQRQLVAEALDRGKPFRLPLPLRLLLRVPILNRLPARVVGLGFGREFPRRAKPGLDFGPGQDP